MHPVNVPTGSSVEKSTTCVCIDWYSEGEERVVEAGGVRITIRFVGRRGRRGRIAISAPAGAVFTSEDVQPTG